MLAFPLEACKARAGDLMESYPSIVAYLKRLQDRPAFKRAIDKIMDVTGEPYVPAL